MVCVSGNRFQRDKRITYLKEGCVILGNNGIVSDFCNNTLNIQINEKWRKLYVSKNLGQGKKKESGVVLLLEMIKVKSEKYVRIGTNGRVADFVGLGAFTNLNL